MRRYLELDIARTIAVIMMIIYHTTYDLSAFYGWDMDVFEGGWKLLARGTASLFLTLVGVGFAISWERNRDMGGPRGDLRIAPTARWRYPPKYVKRGLGLIALGMVVSAVTYVIDPTTYVRFGILHLIGAGILLLPLFVRMREWNAAVGIIVILMGWLVRDAAARTSLLLVFGIRPPFFSSVDYFPLIPWFGVMLMGYAIGHFIYVRHEQRTWTASNWMTAPGRYALVIYLVHQPLIIALLWLLLGSPFG